MNFCLSVFSAIWGRDNVRFVAYAAFAIIRLLGILRGADQKDELRRNDGPFHKVKPVFSESQVPFVEHNIHAFLAETRREHQHPFLVFFPSPRNRRQTHGDCPLRSRSLLRDSRS